MFLITWLSEFWFWFLYLVLGLFVATVIGKTFSKGCFFILTNKSEKNEFGSYITPFGIIGDIEYSFYCVLILFFFIGWPICLTINIILGSFWILWEFGFIKIIKTIDSKLPSISFNKEK